jgi:hypothetical protein
VKAEDKKMPDRMKRTMRKLNPKECVHHSSSPTDATFALIQQSAGVVSQVLPFVNYGK